MWGWVKKAAKVVGNAVRGAVSFVVQAVKAVVHRILGIPDFIGTLTGWWTPEKRIKVEALVLQKNKKPLANLGDVQDVLTLADQVFREQMNVRIVNRQGGRPQMLAAEAPARNLSVTCYPPKVLASDFSSVSSWFRDHQVRTTGGTLFGYGHPVTVFVVENVEGDNAGCCPGFFTDYAVIDPDALGGSEETRLTLAHELGHSCGLFWHSGSGNLMKHAHTGRTRHLNRFQKAIFRSSGHVTRW
jgi:hypothetical protein